MTTERKNADLGTKEHLTSKEIPVVLLDLDDTIFNTTRFLESLGFGKEEVQPFIEGALDFIVALKEAGIKVGVVTHSTAGGYGNKLVEALAERGVELDALVNLTDLLNSKLGRDGYRSTDYNELLRGHGKGKSAKMAELAFKQMKIKPEDYPNIRAVVMGDNWPDLLFARHIKKFFNIENISSVHIAAVDLRAKTISEVDKAIMDLESQKNPTKVNRVKSYKEASQVFGDIFGINLNLGVPKSAYSVGIEGKTLTITNENHFSSEGEEKSKSNTIDQLPTKHRQQAQQSSEKTAIQPKKSFVASRSLGYLRSA